MLQTIPSVLTEAESFHLQANKLLATSETWLPQIFDNQSLGNNRDADETYSFWKIEKVNQHTQLWKSGGEVHRPLVWRDLSMNSVAVSVYEREQTYELLLCFCVLNLHKHTDKKKSEDLMKEEVEPSNTSCHVTRSQLSSWAYVPSMSLFSKGQMQQPPRGHFPSNQYSAVEPLALFIPSVFVCTCACVWVINISSLLRNDPLALTDFRERWIQSKQDVVRPIPECQLAPCVFLSCYWLQVWLILLMCLNMGTVTGSVLTIASCGTLFFCCLSVRVSWVVLW